MSNLKSLFIYMQFTLITLLFVQCDKDDDYIYPSVLTDFMDVYTNNESVIDKIGVDGVNGTLHLGNLVKGTNLKSDTVYRAVGMYSLPDAETESTYIYSLTLIYSSYPVPAEDATNYKTDPLDIESVYRGGGYLNIVALPLVQDRNLHGFGFIENGIEERNGNKILSVTLAHNQNGDRESFPRRVYLSVPLERYQLQKGDSIYFHANVYDEGVKIWKIAY